MTTTTDTPTASVEERRTPVAPAPREPSGTLLSSHPDAEDEPRPIATAAIAPQGVE